MAKCTALAGGTTYQRCDTGVSGSAVAASLDQTPLGDDEDVELVEEKLRFAFQERVFLLVVVVVLAAVALLSNDL